MRRREDKVSTLRKDSAVTGRSNHPEAAKWKSVRPESDAEVEATSIAALLEREDCTLVAWYPSLYAPRTGGAYDSHHQTAGIAGCTRRRSRVAARVRAHQPAIAVIGNSCEPSLRSDTMGSPRPSEPQCE